MEYKHTPCSLLLQKHPESFLRHSDLINLISCEFDLTSAPFLDTKIIKYEIQLPPDVNKIGPNLLDYVYFTIHYFTDTILNSPAGNQLPTQAKKHLWVVSINVEYPTTSQGALYELQNNQT